jgi:hypothetical protein
MALGRTRVRRGKWDVGFVIELVMAHVLARDGATAPLDERFRRFLLYLAQSGLKERIQFPENKPPFGAFQGPVVILDPVYSLNNVAARITEAERRQITARAEQDWEIANFASVENDLEEWKKIFGPRFRVED